MPAKRPRDASVVLVVENDELVRVFAVEMLVAAGMRVVEAHNTDSFFTSYEPC